MQLQTFVALLLGATLGLAVPTAVEERESSCSVGISPARAAQVKNAFSTSGIVPTLIPTINPRVEVSVKYGSKAVNLGNQFLTTETLNAPSLSFDAEPGQDPSCTKYSVFLIDPDVPNPDAGALRMTFLHWELSGVQPNCIAKQSPTTVAIYQSLTPASTQQHRYTFLVYREPANYKPDTLTPQTRLGFNVNAYAAKGGLTLVGGNFLREAVTNGVIT